MKKKNNGLIKKNIMISAYAEAKRVFFKRVHLYIFS